MSDTQALAAELPGKFRSLLSGKDNVSLDVVRVSCLLIVLGLVGFTGWNIWDGRPFNAAEYCGAAAVLIPSICGGLRIKAPTEPEPK